MFSKHAQMTICNAIYLDLVDIFRIFRMILLMPSLINMRYQPPYTFCSTWEASDLVRGDGIRTPYCRESKTH